MRAFKLISTLTCGMLAGTSAWAACPLDASEFDRIQSSASERVCAGIRNPGHAKAENPLEGDLVFAAGRRVRRVGPAPAGMTVLDDGVLNVLYSGRDVAVWFWEARSGESTKCSPDLSVRDIHQGRVQIIYGRDYVSHRDEYSSESYFSKCEKSGRRAIFHELSEADRRILSQYGSGSISNELTDPRVNATLPEILGRDEIVDQIIANIASDSKRSTLLWGPPGVGKTAIVYRLATRIARGEVPEWLQGWSVYLINLGKLSEEGSKGKAEQKMSEIVDAASGKKVILLMDEIHQLVGLGTGRGDSSDVTEVMKTNLANGQLAVIGTLTDSAEEMALIRTKEAFFTRFTRVFVTDPDDAVLMKIYSHKGERLRRQHGVKFTDRILEQLIRLTRQYVPQEHHPRVGGAILDQLAAKLKVKVDFGPNPARGDEHEVTLTELRNEIGIYGNISVLRSAAGEEETSFTGRVRQFRTKIREKYIGQSEAIEAVYRSMVTYAAGNQDPNRPVGTFLFLGPSGVGKTYLAELVAEYFGMPYKEWPMSQFRDEANIATFLGAPPTYVGYNPGGGALTRWINNNPSSVLNFDEIDKANPSILEMLMGLMENGRIVDNSNVEAIFRNGFIFLTSNFAMDLIDAYDKEVLGIHDPEEGQYTRKYEGYIPRNETELKQEIMNKLISDRAFGTYIAGRIGVSRIIVFHHLNPEQAAMIAGFEVKKVLKTIRSEKPVEVSNEVKRYIATKGFSFQFGARKARDMARDLVLFPVSEKLLELDDAKFSKLRVVLNGDGSQTPATRVEVIR